jgi:redox-sensitive bicupin YhaK (pirin superfamily)
LRDDGIGTAAAEWLHYPELPRVERDGFAITVLVGEAFGERAPTRVFSPLAALDLLCGEPAATSLALRPAFEYGALVLAGEAELDGQALRPGSLLYLGCGRERLALRSAGGAGGARLLVIGGEPFGEEILMWWNFVGRDPDEITRAVAEWNAGDARFGEVRGYPGERLAAPLPPWAAR